MQPTLHTLATTIALLTCLLSAAAAPDTLAAGDVADLSGQVTAQATLRSRDNFTSELRYEVTARNQTGQEFLADSLMIVLDRLTNVAGQPVDPLTQRSLLTQVEVVNSDGVTAEGKPFFRVPLDQETLAPHAQTPPVTVRLRNPSFITGLTPSFKVFGRRKEPAPAEKSTRPGPAPESPAPANAARTPEAAPEERQIEALVDLLIRKGLLTEEEWRDAVAAPPE